VPQILTPIEFLPGYPDLQKDAAAVACATRKQSLILRWMEAIPSRTTR